MTDTCHGIIFPAVEATPRRRKFDDPLDPVENEPIDPEDPAEKNRAVPFLAQNEPPQLIATKYKFRHEFDMQFDMQFPMNTVSPVSRESAYLTHKKGTQNDRYPALNNKTMKGKNYKE